MSHRSPVVDAYIIGAGPAGLATAAALRGRGLHGVVLDRSDAIGSSWRRHYDRLHLHTPRELSGLPGMAIPKEMGRWVARDDVVRYLELYAAHHDLDVRLRTAVERVDRSDDGLGWALTLSDGSTLTSPYVVVATGFNHTPVEPDLPGLQDFSGEVVMSRTYRDGSPHAGKDVLVVGSGNTGTELAVDLVEHGAARVRLSVRTIPHILRRSAGPYAAQYTGITVRHLPAALVDRAAALVERATTPDLTAYGLPRPDTGLLTRVERDNAIPVQDVGIIDAIRAGRVEPVAALASFDGGDGRALGRQPSRSPTSSCSPPATPRGSSRSSGTWACSTARATPSPAPGRPLGERAACGSTASPTPSRGCCARSRSTRRRSRSPWRSPSVAASRS